MYFNFLGFWKKTANYPELNQGIRENVPIFALLILKTDSF